MLRSLGPWALYGVAAAVCAFYLNHRAAVVPRWGQWYMASEGEPYVLLQVRAFLSGHLALVPHPSGVGNDYDWGRGGMHQAWGLGVPILAIPFHLLGRLFGAPGFPDGVRFLVLYVITTVVLAHALYRVSRPGPTARVASAAVACFVMLFPAFVGMVAARFLVYEQTIAVGFLWDVLLLSGLLFLLDRCTPVRLAWLCAAAGFSVLVRPPLAVYGACTVVLALIVAARKGVERRAMGVGALAYVAVTVFYFVGNTLRFGSPFHFGYENCVSGAFVNRLTRWGLPFAKVPFKAAAKEMFATLFELQPVWRGGNAFLPSEVLRSLVGERWREYYSPTFDRTILAVAVAGCIAACVRLVRGRLWRKDRALDGEAMVILGAWGIVPAVVLFVFYARLGNIVTRYAVDMAPAFAALALSFGSAATSVARSLSPRALVPVQIAIAAAAAVYVTRVQQWPAQTGTPVDRATIVQRIAEVDRDSVFTPGVPSHFEAGLAHGPDPVFRHLEGWAPDGTFQSGMAFAMPYSPCVAFSFLPYSSAWKGRDDTLPGVRATADSDSLVRCGSPKAEGLVRRLTMCEPHPPAYLLDGMRLYAVASLDEDLAPVPLRLLKIDAVASCPE